MPTNSESHRGDRLRPKRWHRLYWHLTSLRKAFERIIHQHIQDGDICHVVDYGCGNMPYRFLFEPHVGKYEGADLAGNDLAEITLSDAGAIPLADSVVDAIVSSQVLEHVPDPDFYLRESKRVLRSTGLLVLSTHGTWRYHPDPADYWRWTSAGLRKLLEEHGFELIDFDAVMSPPATAIQLFQDFTAQALPRILRPLYCFPFQVTMQLLDAIVPRKHRLRDASVYVVVARPNPRKLSDGIKD